MSSSNRPSTASACEPAEHLCLGVAAVSDEPQHDDLDRAAGPTREKVERFCEALSEAIGIDIQPRVYDDYQALVESIGAGETHLAWLPPIVAVRAVAQGSAIPVVLPVREGDSSFAAALFSRVDSNIMTVADLRGARSAWVDEQSAAGYLVIRAYLRSQGLDLDQAFGEQMFWGSHAAVVEAVLSGRADVGATFAHLEPGRQQVRSAGWGEQPVRIVAMAGPIPADVIAASIRLPSSTIRTLREALVYSLTERLHRRSLDLFEAEGFTPVESHHMALLTHLLEHLDGGKRKFR